MQAYLTNGGLPSSHNCEVAVQWSHDRWLEEGESRVLLGASTLVFGVIGTFLYIPCIIVLLQPDLRCLTAYKLLLVISLCQVFSLFVSCVVSGVFFIQGVVYCNYPHLNYIVGCFVMLTWACTCLSCLILNASRLVDLWNPALHDAIFGGKRVVYTFVIIFLYSMMFFFYAQPTVFNSRELAWMFDPLVYPEGDNFGLYACYITVANNEGTVTATLLLTLLFIASLTYKSIRYKFKMSTTQKQIFVQSTFSGLSTFITASIFVSYQFVDGGRLINYLGLLAWQINTCGELILFLFINKTVQNRVLLLLHVRKPSPKKSNVASATGPSYAVTRERVLSF